MRSKYGLLVLFLIVIAISLNPYVENLKMVGPRGVEPRSAPYEGEVLTIALRAHIITKTFDTRVCLF